MKSSRITTYIDTEFEVCGRRSRGKIKNMSEGGLFVRTASVPEEGEHVDVRFRAGGKEVCLSGLVWWTTNDGRRHRSTGFGLRLLDDDQDIRGLLATL